MRDVSAARRDQLVEHARRTCSPEAAADWIALLRPAVLLVPADAGDDAVAWQGGLPPAAIQEWPHWVVPLQHVLTYDCGVLRAALPTLGLPATGRLSFFYSDSDVNGAGFRYVGGDVASQQGGRVVHSVGGDPMAVAPTGAHVYPHVDLAGIRTVAGPADEAPEFFELRGRHPDGFSDEFHNDYPWPGPQGTLHCHLVGGYAHTRQAAVERISEDIRRTRHAIPQSGDPFDGPGPGEWLVLAQVHGEYDHGMYLGDHLLSWMAHRDDGALDAVLSVQ